MDKNYLSAMGKDVQDALDISDAVPRRSSNSSGDEAVSTTHKPYKFTPAQEIFERTSPLYETSSSSGRANPSPTDDQMLGAVSPLMNEKTRAVGYNLGTSVKEALRNSRRPMEAQIQDSETSRYRGYYGR